MLRIRKSRLVDVSVAVAIVAGTAIWVNTRTAPIADDPTQSVTGRLISLKDSHVEGAVTARLAIIEYSDFQCPFCRAFTEHTLPQLRTDYFNTGKALFAFRHLPLTAIHPYAQTAAESAECAARQSRFWTMHDRLFASPKITQSTPLTVAHEIGLDSAAFSHCITGEAKDSVAKDIASARDLGVTSTPTFIIGTVEKDGTVKITHRVSGAIPLTEFRRLLDRLLK